MSRAKKPEFSRPYTTLYYGSITDGEKAWVTQGACKTEDGAKVATAVKLILGQYGMARVYDKRNEVLIFTFKRTVDGIKMWFGREEGSNVVQLKRRRK